MNKNVKIFQQLYCKTDYMLHREIENFLKCTKNLPINRKIVQN